MDPTASTGTAMRYERVAFLNTGTIAAPVWALMGKGFEALDDALNPNVSEKTYVSDKSASKTITGYAPEWSIEGSVIKDEATITFLRAIGETLAVGESAEAEVIVFDLWDVDSGTKYVDGYKYPVVVQMDSIGGGSGGEELAFSGSLLANGDPTAVSFDTVNKAVVESS